MRYLCLVYLEKTADNDQAKSDQYDNAVDFFDSSEDFDANGHFIAFAPLQPADAAAMIRVRNGTVTIADGCFDKSNEQLSGFCLVDARDLNEVVRAISKIQPARGMSVEVRPLRECTPR